MLYGSRIEVGPTRMVPYRIRLPRSKLHALQDCKIKSADEDANMQSQDAKEGELNGGRDAVGSSRTGFNVRRSCI